MTEICKKCKPKRPEELPTRIVLPVVREVPRDKIDLDILPLEHRSNEIDIAEPLSAAEVELIETDIDRILSSPSQPEIGNFRWVDKEGSLESRRIIRRKVKKKLLLDE